MSDAIELASERKRKMSKRGGMSIHKEEVLLAVRIEKLIDRWRQEAGEDFRMNYANTSESFNHGVQTTLLDCADSLRSVLAGFPVLLMMRGVREVKDRIKDYMKTSWGKNELITLLDEIETEFLFGAEHDSSRMKAYDITDDQGPQEDSAEGRATTEVAINVEKFKQS